MYYNGFNCWGSGIHNFWWTGIAILLIGVAFVLLVKRRDRRSEDASALKSLDLLFASGDISEEEYQHRKRVLKNQKGY